MENIFSGESLRNLELNIVYVNANEQYESLQERYYFSVSQIYDPRNLFHKKCCREHILECAILLIIVMCLTL